MERAAYQAEVRAFLAESEANILGKLTRNYSFRHLEEQQIAAWSYQIKDLKRALINYPTAYLFFEFEIPRIGKRADIILLISNYVVIVEYKVGAKNYDLNAIDQVYDYALDLKNFHGASHFLTIFPLLVATDASKSEFRLQVDNDGVARPILTNSSSLSEILDKLLVKNQPTQLDAELWAAAPYHPTPTIIEAAQHLYEGHSVEEISRNDAGAYNLTKTYNKIAEIIEYAKSNNRKIICLITGVPGAGKTLAGLHIATKRIRFLEDEHAVFLSGNSPLVAVLKEALARNKLESIRNLPKKNRLNKTSALREAGTFIQNIHHFRDEYLKSHQAPIEKVVIFDEAQRAWNKEKTSSFMKTKKRIDNFNKSEPDFLLSVMNRHDDWCVVICLIGEGQEINTGEAGISEWIYSLSQNYQNWSIYSSDKVLEVDEGAHLNKLDIHIETDLHLGVSLRSFRAENLSAFVGALIKGDKDAAKIYKGKLLDYPIYLTRNLNSAKEWLQKMARGSERIGLVASSNAIRLKPDGVFIKGGINPPLWFLNSKNDIRSSYHLEDVATEFEVQGLELDWVGVCWDANFRYEDSGWKTMNFKGTKWQAVHKEEDQRYISNAYRVLLTRGRQGIIIFIPHGNNSDTTRLCKYYDKTFNFLKDCGIDSIDQ